MVRQPEQKRSYAVLGMLIGIVIGFIIGLVIHQIDKAVFFCGLIGMLIGSFKIRD